MCVFRAQLEANDWACPERESTCPERESMQVMCGCVYRR
jgi:ferredoxin-thioredoxin reductase catalytic subunit